MKYEHKGVYLVKMHPNPSGLKKYRLAVLIQNEDLTNKLDTCVIVPLSTKFTKSLSLYEVELDYSFLKKPSVALVLYIQCVKKKHLTRKLGKISEKKLESIYAGIDLMMFGY